jgi:hypothetical protein
MDCVWMFFASLLEIIFWTTRGQSSSTDQQDISPSGQPQAKGSVCSDISRVSPRLITCILTAGLRCRKDIRDDIRAHTLLRWSSTVLARVHDLTASSSSWIREGATSVDPLPYLFGERFSDHGPEQIRLSLIGRSASREHLLEIVVRGDLEHIECSCSFVLI